MTQTKQKKKVAKRPGQVSKIQAVGASWRPRYLSPELSGLFRPLKKQITVRIDADVLAWLKRGGRGYQTRINQLLRKAMAGEKGMRD